MGSLSSKLSSALGWRGYRLRTQLTYVVSSSPHRLLTTCLSFEYDIFTLTFIFPKPPGSRYPIFKSRGTNLPPVAYIHDHPLWNNFLDFGFPGSYLGVILECLEHPSEWNTVPSWIRLRLFTLPQPVTSSDGKGACLSNNDVVRLDLQGLQRPPTGELFSKLTQCDLRKQESDCPYCQPEAFSFRGTVVRSYRKLVGSCISFTPFAEYTRLVMSRRLATFFMR
jgi:hypothetical protein